MTPSIDDAKAMARRLRAAMDARGLAATHSDTLELVAAQLGFRDWNTTSAALNPDGARGPRFDQSVPVMLSLDETICRSFYCDFLGFEVDFESRLAPNMPAYLGFRRGSVQLHLTPRRDDAAEGAAVLIWMKGVDDYRRELSARSDGHAVPDIERQSWARELVITDPFGNRLRFCEQPTNGVASRPIGMADTDRLDVTAGEMPRDTASFDLVRELGAALPGVKATGDKLGTSLRMGGEILACSAIHKSADPDTLMVRLGYEGRDALLQENPTAFYLTGHYQGYPVVLVRLRQVDRDMLGALLRDAWEFMQHEGK